MAGQKQGVRWLLAAAIAVALSGCVSVPDAIKGTSPTPQQDLVRVMNAPQLYVGQEARFGGKVGSTPYKFMLMNATGYKRWNVVQQVVMPPQPIDPWMLGPRPWGYGYGGWGWYNPGPAEVRNVVTE